MTSTLFPSHRTPSSERMAMLLRRCLVQLSQWQQLYGEHDPEWMPPAGDVRLAEDIDQALSASAWSCKASDHEDGPSDTELRTLWKAQGGSFHGPRIETGTMPEAVLLPFLRSLMQGKPSQEEMDSRLAAEMSEAARNNLR